MTFIRHYHFHQNIYIDHQMITSSSRLAGQMQQVLDKDYIQQLLLYHSHHFLYWLQLYLVPADQTHIHSLTHNLVLEEQEYSEVKYHIKSKINWIKIIYESDLCRLIYCWWCALFDVYRIKHFIIFINLYLLKSKTHLNWKGHF